MNSAPVSIVAYEEGQNLVKVTWSQRFLEEIKRAHKLKHCEAVLFINKAQDRFRLVACFFGLAVLILPPTEPEQRLSLYLKVGQFLRKFSNTARAEACIAAEVELAQDRINRRAAAAETATKKRRK